MVLFNYSTKEITAKIVYYGPGLCGKTTNLQFIYDSLPQAINKGKMLSLATKTDRTLFFDFLPIDLGTIRGMRTRLQLYTVPGQVFYNTTRKLVLKGADGVVFVADSQKRMIDANLESFGNLEENLAEHDMKLSEIPMILQFNKRDLPDVASMEELNSALNKFNAPIYEAVAPTGIGVHETLKAITRLVLNSLKERYADKREQKTDTRARESAVMAATANKPLAAEAHTPKSAPTPAPEPSYELPNEPALTHPPVQTAAEVSEMGSLSSEQPRPASPIPAPSFFQSDEGSLSFDLPELEELADNDAGPAAGEPAIAADLAATDLMAAEPELPPELMGDDLSPTDLMPAITTDLVADDDLLELAPETELPIDAGGEELLELADEPLADLAHLEDSIAMPLLDVTSEMAFEDEPNMPAPVFEPEAAGIPLAAEMPFVDGLESSDMDNSAQLQSMLLQDSPAGPAVIEPDGLDESFFEPVETGAVVAEDHHDTALPLADIDSLSSAAPIPLALEPEEDRIQEESDPFSVTPRIPLSDLASPPLSQVTGISRAPGIAREINLPVKLEIGGRCISFELKISLDLTEIAAQAGSPMDDEREVRS